MKRKQGEEPGLPPDVVMSNFYVDVANVKGKFVADSYVLKISAHNKHEKVLGGEKLNGFYDKEYKAEVLSRRTSILRVVGNDKEMAVKVSYLTLMLGLNFRVHVKGRQCLTYVGTSRSAVLEYLGSIRGNLTVLPCHDIRGLRVPFGFPRRHDTPWFLRLHAVSMMHNNKKGMCVLCREEANNIHGFPNIYGRDYEGCFVHDLCAIMEAQRNVPGDHFMFYRTFPCPCGYEHEWFSRSHLFPIITKAFVVGDDIAGIHKSLTKITRNAIVHQGNSQQVYKAIALMLRGCGLSYRGFELPVPNLFEATNYMHEYPQTKGGALLMRNVKAREEGGVFVGNFMNPYRSEAANTAAFVSVGVAHFILHELQKGKVAAITSLNENVMAPLKTALKGEVKVDSPVPRVFQVASIFDLSIEKVIFSPLQKLFSGRFPFMVGFRWTHRGANQLAEYMSYNDVEYRWADYDISGLDVDLIASVVIAIMCTLFGFFHVDFDAMAAEFKAYSDDVADVNVKKLLVFYIMYSKMVQNYSGKIITWPDFFRIVIGGMSSGQLNTSFFDTLYCIVMVYCWLLHCAMLVPLKDRRLWIERNIANFHFLIYGDDGLMRIRKDSGLHVLSRCCVGPLPSYQSFLKDHFSLTVKEEESGEYGNFLTEVTDKGEVAYPGPKILQRYFVWNEQHNVVAPLRVTSRAAPRLLCDSTEFEDADAYRLQILRIIGHMYDCAGTNYYYYNCLRMMHASIVNVLHAQGESLYPEDDEDRRKFVLTWESKIFQIVGREKEIASRMIEVTGLEFIPSYDEIDDLFNASNVPQEYYDTVEQIMNRIGYYEVA